MINHCHSRGKKLIKFLILRKKIAQYYNFIIPWNYLVSLLSLSLSQTYIGNSKINYFLGRSIGNINYTKFKTKENLNISTSQKIQKTKIEIHKVLQLLSKMFHILKSLHDIFIINPMRYIFFNVYNQIIIYSLISHLIDLFQIC